MNKLAQIDLEQGSKRSSRAASAQLSRGSLGSQIEPATAISPRPHSAEGSQREEQSASTPAGNTEQPSSAKPPTAGSEELGSRASSAASEREASHSRSDTTPLAHRSIATQTKTPSSSSAQSSREPHTQSPSDTCTRSASATYTRSNLMSCSLPSRGQSATTHSSSLQPPATTSLSSHSRVSSAASSCAGEGSETPLTPQPAPATPLPPGQSAPRAQSSTCTPQQ